MHYSFVILFFICPIIQNEFYVCSDGQAWSKYSCAHAERAIREGLRSGYRLDVIECTDLR